MWDELIVSLLLIKITGGHDDKDSGVVKRIRIVLNVVSAILCCLFLTIFPISYRRGWGSADTWDGKLHSKGGTSLKFEVHDGDIWFFNQGGPNLGITLGLEAEHSAVSGWTCGDYGFGKNTLTDQQGKVIRTESGFTAPGLNLFDLWWPGTEIEWWTLTLSLWYPILLTAILPGLWGSRRIKRKISPAKIVSSPSREPSGIVPPA